MLRNIYHPIYNGYKIFSYFFEENLLWFKSVNITWKSANLYLLWFCYNLHYIAKKYTVIMSFKKPTHFFPIKALKRRQTFYFYFLKTSKYLSFPLHLRRKKHIFNLSYFILKETIQRCCILKSFFNAHKKSQCTNQRNLSGYDTDIRNWSEGISPLISRFNSMHLHGLYVTALINVQYVQIF